jgi:hypothetical protein
MTSFNDEFPHSPYAQLERQELKALRAFYMAWLGFHAANQETGSTEFKRTRLQRAAQKLADAVAEVRKFDPKVVQ